MQIVIPMAGLGSRLNNYDKPNPLINVNGKPMIIRALESLKISGDYFFIIRKSPHLDELYETLKYFDPTCKIHILEELTRGAAETVLCMEQEYNPQDKLVIANCDQIMEWNSDLFLHSTRNPIYDGLVVTYHAQTEKNSYARLDEYGNVTEILEKQVVSTASLNGIHFWKKTEDFIRSAKKMIMDGRTTNNEYYVAPTFNLLIEEGKKIGIFHIPVEQHHAVGTPEDLEKYLKHVDKRNENK